LNVKVERTIRVGDELVAISERQPVQRIWNEIALSVVGGDRPERIDRREFALVEMEDVLAIAVERSALSVESDG